MDKDFSYVLLSRAQIEETVKRLAHRIDSDYRGKQLLLVGLLKGSVVFMADLMRELKTPCRIDFMTVSSYKDRTMTNGRPEVLKDVSVSLKGRDVLVVEDIVDSGVTLHFILEYLRAQRPASIKLCALLDKPQRRTADISVDYTGMQIPDVFAVGYGLDFAEDYRNLPYIGVLRPEIYTR